MVCLWRSWTQLSTLDGLMLANRVIMVKEPISNRETQTRKSPQFVHLKPSLLLTATKSDPHERERGRERERD